MSSESPRRLLLVAAAVGVAAIAQAYRLFLGEGGAWALVALVGFSLVALASGWQLWSVRRSGTTRR
ncbi:hypothetical protein [Halogeometricum luteum]|uniref:Uncharacterized protein n=1 Tax=Halogeometricum luteum TaxID=2950537 RepID=A0ABU2G7V9_9EURY|nr:hypothetical protein [Halogeometricum sp. S3BR5-2]MDS0296374.1 hypothetical protein [Halogeometricum sp. S3BR5-2]